MEGVGILRDKEDKSKKKWRIKMDYRNKDVADWNEIAPDKQAQLRSDMGENIKAEVLSGSIAFEILESAEFVLSESFVDHASDSMYMLEDIPQTTECTSMELSMNGSPTGTYLKNPERYKIPISRLSTERMNKTATQMKKEGGWDAEQIESLSIPSLLGGMDSKVIDLARASVSITGADITCNSCIPSKLDIIQAIQFVMCDNTFPSKILMRKDDFVAFLLMGNLSDINIVLGPGIPERSQVDSEDTYESFIARGIASKNISASLEGLKIILPLDDNVLEPGEVYVFSTKKSLGKMYYGEARFEFEIRFRMVQWQADLELGMNIFNVYGVSRMQVTPLGIAIVEEEPEQKIGIIKRILRFLRIGRK